VIGQSLTTPQSLSTNPRERTGGITFGDFMEFLSIICKGSEEDKLLWTFEFYDTNRDGVISKEELLKVTDSIHELMGGTNPANSCESRARAEQVFANMDADHDGFVSLQEFMDYCHSKEEVKRSLMVKIILSTLLTTAFNRSSLDRLRPHPSPTVSYESVQRLIHLGRKLSTISLPPRAKVGIF